MSFDKALADDIGWMLADNLNGHARNEEGLSEALGVPAEDVRAAVAGLVAADLICGSCKNHMHRRGKGYEVWPGRWGS